MSTVNDKNNQTHEALKALRNLDLEPSPYLAKRVQANLKSKTSDAVSFWQKWLWPSLSAALTVVVVFLLVRKPPQFHEMTVAEYSLHQPYIIKVDIRSIKESEFAYAEVQLGGENIQFTSSHSEINETKKLMLSWEQLLDKQYIPIVVEGVKPGKALVTVNFYDKNNKVLATKEMALSFKGKTI